MATTFSDPRCCTEFDIVVGARLYQLGQEVKCSFDPNRHRPCDKGLPVIVHKIVDGIVHLRWADTGGEAGKISAKEMASCGRYYPCH